MDFITTDAKLYDDWKKASRFQKEQKLTALLRQLGGAIATAVRTYQTSALPFPVLQTEGTRLAVEAIKDWDPSRGMTLASYVIAFIKNRMSRYVIEHQNVARIPENKARMIGPLREAETELSNRFGREPTTDELADHMAVSVGHVAKLRKMIRADVLESSSDFSSLEQYAHDPQFDRVMLAYYSLNQDEKQVFDYSLGMHGQPKLSPGEMAAKLKMTSVRISQLKKQVADKLAPYMRT